MVYLFVILATAPENLLRNYGNPSLPFIDNVPSLDSDFRESYQFTIALAELLPSQSKDKYSLKTFLDRLRWHDKFSQRHYFHPELAFKNRYSEFDDWYSPEELKGQKLEYFQAWCEGRTGYPMVDASMRQLNTSGWMN